MTARVLLVSNRLPVTVRRTEGHLAVERSAGGLATGLSGVHSDSGGLWIGWSGCSESLSPAEAKEIDARFGELGLLGVPLTDAEVQGYYEGFCNAILWPLLHYQLGQLPLDTGGFELYEAINRRFADAVVEVYRPGDLIWVHDYQLMLVPALLRERLPEASIGFFLHVPFPSSDVFRVLPFRERLLRGMLGADLVGFHTAGYMRHFASSVLRTLGVANEVDLMRWDQRVVRLGVFPMSVDAPGLAALAEAPEVRRQAAALREPNGLQLLVGIDRLDYTKGIPRRLLAFEQLLRRHPDLCEKVRLIQVAVPSRTAVGAYQEFRDLVDALIGRIHGAFATPSWIPVHYIFRGLPGRELAALYLAADTMLVTPLRDGMNLVAKEFVASRSDEGGALVLSEFAGAASELAEALFINPYDIHGTAEVLYRALTMPDAERRTRMMGLRRRVFDYDVHRWASSFVAQLARRDRRRTRVEPSAPTLVADVLQRLRAAPQLHLLLDYDGTLAPIAPTPELARPDEELLALLGQLVRRPRTHVAIVSGRSRQTLQSWLGHLPLELYAEHGLWRRRPGDAGAMSLPVPPTPWRDPVLAILRDYAARTPGSLVEEKAAGLAWHYRAADPEYGPLQANELRLHLTELLSNTPVEILACDKVIELRLHGVSKARAVVDLGALPPESLVAAFGDDVTDEDMFRALPAGSIAVHVGQGPSRAEVRLDGVEEVRALLRSLVL